MARQGHAPAFETANPQWQINPLGHKDGEQAAQGILGSRVQIYSDGETVLPSHPIWQEWEAQTRNPKDTAM